MLWHTAKSPFDFTHVWTTGSATTAYDETYAYSTIGNLTNKDGVAYSYPASGASSVRPHTPTSVGGTSYVKRLSSTRHTTPLQSRAIKINCDGAAPIFRKAQRKHPRLKEIIGDSAFG